MSLYVYPTDHDWFDFLTRQPGIDEINFWQPGGKQRFTRLEPGDLPRSVRAIWSLSLLPVVTPKSRADAVM
jgi:hypothetical protein